MDSSKTLVLHCTVSPRSNSQSLIDNYPSSKLNPSLPPIFCPWPTERDFPMLAKKDALDGIPSTTRSLSGLVSAPVQQPHDHKVPSD